MPKELSESYAELYDRKVTEYDAEDRHRLEISLSLLLVPMRPTYHEFTEFVFWDGEDDGGRDSDDDDRSHNGNSSETCDSVAKRGKRKIADVQDLTHRHNEITRL